MLLHKAQFGWISRTQKTTKTECGKRVACSQIAIDKDTDCPGCRAAVDTSTSALLQIADSCAKQGNSQALVAVRAAAADPKRYRTIYFL